MVCKTLIDLLLSIIDYTRFVCLLLSVLLTLLSYAKMFKNIPKYHVVRNFPRNIA